MGRPRRPALHRLSFKPVSRLRIGPWYDTHRRVSGILFLEDQGTQIGTMADEGASPPEVPEPSEEAAVELEAAAQGDGGGEAPETNGEAAEASSAVAPEGDAAAVEDSEEVVEATNQPPAGDSVQQEAAGEAPEAVGEKVPASDGNPDQGGASPADAEQPPPGTAATSEPTAGEPSVSETPVAAAAAEAALADGSAAKGSSVDEGRLQELLEALQDLAVRVVELFIEWDEDGNGSTDRKEFTLALPVLGLYASQSEADALFDKITGNAESIEHWTLFRNLVSTTKGVDVEAAEADARQHLTEIQTKHSLGESAFWQRETGGKSVNKHALRKRDGALRTWNKQTGDPNANFMNSLGNRNESPLLDSELGGVGARQLQGSSVLNPNATLEEQLLLALDEHMARIIGKPIPDVASCSLPACAA